MARNLVLKTHRRRNGPTSKRKENFEREQGEDKERKKSGFRTKEGSSQGGCLRVQQFRVHVITRCIES